VKLQEFITIRVKETTYETYQSNPVIAAHARSVFRSIVDGEIVVEPDGETFTGVEDANPQAEYIATLEEHNRQLIEAIENAVPYQANLETLTKTQSELIKAQEDQIEKMQKAIERMTDVAHGIRSSLADTEAEIIQDLIRLARNAL
jgi:hypothetical protein